MIFQNKKMCCGCTACKSVCPVSAIVMLEDQKGFLYPFIDKERCIKCGKCIEVCEWKKSKINIESTTQAYAVVNKDLSEIKTSRSAAFFPILYRYVLEKKGVVFGCVLTDKFNVEHTYAENIVKAKKFKGSKYVQSDLKNTFLECERFLKQKRWVLFSGTGCQVHGLLSYLNLKHINIEKLITCDIVCHGVTSPKMWKDYLRMYEKYNGEILSVNFRDKDMYGWKAHLESFVLKDGRIKGNTTNNAFYINCMYRESCYNCKYTCIHRASDFTIGDFWGIDTIDQDIKADMGCSLVLVRSDKAKQIFIESKEAMIYKEFSLEKVLQPQLQFPTIKPQKYDEFWEDYIVNGDKMIKRHFFPNKYQIFQKRISCRVKKVLQNIKLN